LEAFEPNVCTVRVVALSPDSNEILSVPAADGLYLPTVVIPRFERFAESLTAAMRRQWNSEVICLFPPAIDSGEDRAHHYHVVECWRQTGTHSRQTRSVPARSLTEESFANADDYWAVRHSLDECNQDGRERGLHPFAHPGWFRQLRAWVSQAVTPLGFELTDAFQQLNASPSFSLIRFETTGTPVWFKAVGEPNLQEFGITFLLAHLFPDFVAPVLARRTDWRGWLSPDISGQNLGDTLDIETWRTVAASLARLQLASIGNQTELLKAGARDLRTPVLGELLAPFFEAMTELMGKQAKFPPPALSAPELRWLREEIQQALATFSALDIPDTLGSSDLNPRNIIVGAGRTSFLDWSEAYVGHPFFSFAYLLEHFRRSGCGDDEGELTASYLVPWRALLSSPRISSALASLPLLAVFAFAAGSNLWRQDAFLHSRATSGYLRALTRRMNLEAKQRRSEDICRV
jgi:Phosphotransferase enzyme family